MSDEVPGVIEVARRRREMARPATIEAMIRANMPELDDNASAIAEKMLSVIESGALGHNLIVSFDRACSLISKIDDPDLLSHCSTLIKNIITGPGAGPVSIDRNLHQFCTMMLDMLEFRDDEFKIDIPIDMQIMFMMLPKCKWRSVLRRQKPATDSLKERRILQLCRSMDEVTISIALKEYLVGANKTFEVAGRRDPHRAFIKDVRNCIQSGVPVEWYMASKTILAPGTELDI